MIKLFQIHIIANYSFNCIIHLLFAYLFFISLIVPVYYISLQFINLFIYTIVYLLYFYITISKSHYIFNLSHLFIIFIFIYTSYLFPYQQISIQLFYIKFYLKISQTPMSSIQNSYQTSQNVYQSGPVQTNTVTYQTTGIPTGYTTTTTGPIQTYQTGGNTYYGGNTVVGGTTTTTQVVRGTPVVTGTQVIGGSNVYGTNYALSASQLGGKLINKAVAEEIPVQSRIEYIPFEKKFIEYDQVERVERIPIERIITEYEEVRRTERVPVQRIIQDYYAVEYQVQYIPKIVEQKVIDYVQQQRQFERVQYLPIETQIIHYPEAELAHSQVYKNQNVYTSGVQRATTQNVVYSNVGNVGGQTTTVVGGPTVVGGQTVVRQTVVSGGNQGTLIGGSNVVGGNTVTYGTSSSSYGVTGGNTYIPGATYTTTTNVPTNAYTTNVVYGTDVNQIYTGGNTVTYANTSGSQVKEQYYYQ